MYQISRLPLSCHLHLNLYLICLFPIPSNVHIVDIKYPHGICSPIFVVDDFPGLFFTFIYSFNQRFNIYIIIYGILSDFKYRLNFNILVSSKGITAPQKPIITYISLWDSSFAFVLKE